MSERRRWWHWTDILLLLGILLMSVWAPAYLAEDAVTQEVSESYAWDLRAPRDGDRVVLDLIFQDVQGSEKIHEGVLDLSFRGPRPGDPEGTAAALVQQVDWLNLTIDNQWFSAEANTRVTFLGADGKPFALGLMGTYPGAAVTTTEYVVEMEGWHREREDHFWFVADRFHHVTSGLEVLTVDQRMGTLYGRDVAEYKGNLLHAADGGRADEELAQMFPFMSGGPNLSTCTGNGTSPIIRWYQIQIRLQGTCEGHQWRWYAEDFPIPVGRHFRAIAAEVRSEREKTETAGQIDFVPALIERGSGSPLPFARQYLGMTDTSEPLPDRDLLDEAPRVRIGDLESSPDPLLLGASLRDLVAAIDESNETGALRTYHDRGARIAAFSWKIGFPDSQPGPDADVLPVPLPVPVPTGPSETRYPVEWKLVMFRDEGDWGLYQLETEIVDGGAIRISEVSDECAGGDRCDHDLITGATLDDDVPVPAWFLERIHTRIDDNDPASPGEFYFSPFFNGTRAMFIGLEPRGHHQPEMVPQGTVLPEMLPQIGRGFVGWGNTSYVPADGWSRYGGFQMANGQEVGDIRWRLGEGTPTASPLTAGSTGFEVIVPVSAVPASIGIALILLGLVIRVARMLWASMHYPIIAGFYAKIARSEVLTHGRRQEIVSLLEADPGLTASEVQRRLGYGWGATIHHLETLVRNEHLTTMQHGRKRHYFSLGGDAASGARRLQVVIARDPIASGLLEAIQAHPGATATELADLLRRPRSGLSRTASRLERIGMLEKRKDGRDMRFYPMDQ